ncbi:hypothetical protein AVEN_184697-1 [Araneus ventricosus]|uniref:Uncharacterized protein n=1 Tax=Araneus ventricosus TaxID=182803 RepID=A0A4Y2L5B6_ARAVE|nr:hypothetical protein AVEN_184697-1 [Araneus ventricosus]
MMRTTPELATPSPNFRATPAGGRLATTYDLGCNRPHTRRIFGGIGFRTCAYSSQGDRLGLLNVFRPVYGLYRKRLVYCFCDTNRKCVPCLRRTEMGCG